MAAKKRYKSRTLNNFLSPNYFHKIFVLDTTPYLARFGHWAPPRVIRTARGPPEKDENEGVGAAALEPPSPPLGDLGLLGAQDPPPLPSHEKSVRSSLVKGFLEVGL